MTISFVAILIIACAMALLARRLKLPYTVVLVIAGLVASALNGPGDANRLGIDLQLTPDLLLQLFLPILLFEAAFHVDLSKFLRNKRFIFCLAIPGVIIGMLLATVLFVPVTKAIGAGLDWQAALLIAAMLAATDPISVVALFKEFTVSKRLAIIIEGESLINDGIAVVLFGVVVKITADHLGLTLPHLDSAGGVQAMAVLSHFLWEVFLGAAIGLAAGLGISYITSKVDDHLIEVALTAIAAFGSNALAMHLHASGVIAVVTCGMMIGNIGTKRGMSPTTHEAVLSFWEFAAFLANSFVFILIGLEIDLRGFWGDAGLILAFFAIMTLVRAIVVGGVSTLVRREELRLPRPWLPVITWAGVRGSLSMVLAMMLVATTDAGTAHHDTILNIVYGVVLLSILAQGTTMAWLMKRAGLISEAQEETEYREALARRQAIRCLLDELEQAERQGTLSRATYEKLHAPLLERRAANDQRITNMLKHTPTLNDLETQMHTHHLLALEKKVYRDLEKEGSLDHETMESLIKDATVRNSISDDH